MSTGRWTESLAEPLDDIARLHDVRDIVQLAPRILRSAYMNAHPSTATEERLVRAMRIAEGRLEGAVVLIERQLAERRADIAVLADYRQAKRAGHGPRAA